jgi:KipI family sensor histidine kinase inhibitor
MFKYFPSGDSAIIIKASDQISVEANNTIRRLLTRVEMESIPGITDFIPSYNELMICFNPSLTGFHKLLDIVRSLEPSIADIHLPPSTLKEVPVLYGGDTPESIGPDLEDVARFNKLSVDDVIQIHSSVTYLVYMLGFTPGFCYLGGMDSRIAMPRKETPRLKIPEGSVGIADKQTGIYPIESPGGWQLIGQTPLKLFNPNRQPEFLFQIGDTLRFKPISENEFLKLKQEQEYQSKHSK